MNKTNFSEITLKKLIGLKFNLSQIEDLESDFKALYQGFYSENIELFNPIYPIKLVVVKTGFLDLRFDRIGITEDKYLRVFMTTNDAGIVFFKKNRPEVDFQAIVEDWNNSFDSLKKPLEFVIKDACHTNAKYIWKNKYFYG
ncbi:hypothetical protein [uncultured Microscilla sp.]|uniref:hypothetical protein n=1 Tax=uncultured Microscilla sp. TaxID=432653 RepID=UPI00262B4558|nr:hypothetical protein [uncultured Microscilla sp.]